MLETKGQESKPQIYKSLGRRLPALSFLSAFFRGSLPGPRNPHTGHHEQVTVCSMPLPQCSRQLSTGKAGMRCLNPCALREGRDLRQRQANERATWKKPRWSKQRSDASRNNRLANVWCDQTPASYAPDTFSHFLVFHKNLRKWSVRASVACL